VESRVVDLVAEHETGALMVVGDEDKDAENHQHAEYVPAHRDVVEQREQGVGEDVDDRVQEEDDQEQHELVVEDRRGIRRREVDAADRHAVDAEHGVEEDRRAVADAGDDADQADHVEPAGKPAPAGAAKLCRPPVGTTGRREGRSELGHREPHQQDEPAEDRPAERNPRWTAGGPGEREVREDAGEDRDDRERDREVREPAPGADELLSVAELRQSLDVLVDFLLSPGHRPLLSAYRPAVGAASVNQSRPNFNAPRR
jgi:hypothetical protein